MRILPQMPLNSSFNQQPSLKKVKNPDRYQDTMIPAKACADSWGSCVLQWVVFPFSLIWELMKGTVRILTCGLLCQNRLCSETQLKLIQPVIQKWNNWLFQTNQQEKKRVWESLCRQYPYIKEDVVLAYVASKRDFELDKKKEDPVEIDQWNTANLATRRNEAIKELERCAPSILENYKGFLEEEIASRLS